MIEIGNVVAVLAASFGLGVFWYEFLRRPQKDRYRLTAISFVGVLIGEGIVTSGVAGGPAVYGLHPVAALISSFAAIYLHTAWAEKKAWPWEIIEDLGTVKSSLKSVSMPSVSMPKVSVGSSSNAASAKTEAKAEETRAEKAA